MDTDARHYGYRHASLWIQTRVTMVTDTRRYGYRHALYNGQNWPLLLLVPHARGDAGRARAVRGARRHADVTHRPCPECTCGGTASQLYGEPDLAGRGGIQPAVAGRNR